MDDYPRLACRLRLGRRWLPRRLHIGQIASGVQHGDDLHEIWRIENAIDDAIAAEEDFADDVLMAGFRHGAATARQEGQTLDGEHEPFGELPGIEG